MLLDFGWSELMLIGVVALIVIGPKDLPRALRIAGYWVKKARTLSREFQNSVEQMIRDAELEEVRDELKKATEFDLNKEFHNTIDPKGEIAEALRPPELPDFSRSSTAAPAGTDAAPAPVPAPPPAAIEAPAEPEPAALPLGGGEPAADHGAPPKP